SGPPLPAPAGTASFGAGGANARLIVEEYPGQAAPTASGEHMAILLSARTAAQLQQRARALLDFVRSRLAALDLAAMAYTLQVGREAMDERLAFLVRSVDQL